MLEKNIFLSHEPRNVFPIFKDVENHISYVFRENTSQNPFNVSKYIFKRIIKGRDIQETNKFFKRILVDSFRGIEINFRGAVLSMEGKLICDFGHLRKVKYGEGFDISINNLLRDKNINITDSQFLLIADRGLKLSPFSYTTGTVSATYKNSNGFTCYRNGIFARPVNEFSHHKPRGFRSIAPHMFCNKEVMASAYFFNFSSDPFYDHEVNPNVKLINSANEEWEGKFGSIKPFGAKESSLEEIFGEKVINFLDKGDGSGTLIAEESSHTLGSIHLLRNKLTGSMSMEHTRPTHMYVI